MVSTDMLKNYSFFKGFTDEELKKFAEIADGPMNFPVAEEGDRFNAGKVRVRVGTAGRKVVADGSEADGISSKRKSAITDLFFHRENPVIDVWRQAGINFHKGAGMSSKNRMVLLSEICYLPGNFASSTPEPGQEN
jgi:hypothetical protein